MQEAVDSLTNIGGALREFSVYPTRITLLSPNEFQTKHPQGAKIVEGNFAIVFYDSSDPSRVIKKSNIPTSFLPIDTPPREALLTEAVAVSRIKGVPIEVAIDEKTTQISVPKAKGVSYSKAFSTYEIPESAASHVLNVQVARCIKEAHDHGVVIMDIKPDQFLVNMKQDGSFEVEMIDYSSGAVMPSIDAKALANLIADAQSLDSYASLQRALGVEGIKRFIRAYDQLTESSESFWEVRTFLHSNEVFKYFHSRGERQRLEDLQKEFDKRPETPSKIKTKDLYLLLDQDKAAKIQMVKNALSETREITKAPQQILNTSDFDLLVAKAGQAFADRLARLLGYTDATLKQMNGLPITYRLPSDREDAFFNLAKELGLLRDGSLNPYSGLRETSAVKVKDIIYKMRKLYLTYVLEDYKQFLEGLKLRYGSSFKVKKLAPKLEEEFNRARSSLKSGNFESLIELDATLYRIIEDNLAPRH